MLNRHPFIQKGELPGVKTKEPYKKKKVHIGIGFDNEA